MRTRNRENTIRERRNKSIEVFLNEFDFQRQLADQDELQLAKKAHKGDLTALSLLVNAHLPLVKIVANNYRNQGVYLQELYYVGNIGLIKAASRFDATKADTFRHYAVWWIRQSILKALHEQAHIEMAPSIMIQELWNISSTFNRVETVTELEPTNQEMRELVQTKVYEIANLHKLPVEMPQA